MAQHIGLERIDENGKLLERSNINFADFINILYKIENYKDKYPLLSYVDPYGDTFLNLLQRPDFVDELKRFINDNDLGDQQELITFISKIDVHQYIRFI